MEFREDRRRKAFQDNLENIRKHNKEYENGRYSFKLSPNSLADLTNQQYLRHYVRLTNSVFDMASDQDYIVANEYDSNAYPASLDWRLKGFNTRPSNQRSCGSCYAFSIAHSVEGQLFKKLNRIIELRQVAQIHIEKFTTDIENIFFFEAHNKLSIAVLIREITAVLGEV